MAVKMEWAKPERSMTNGNCVKVRQPVPGVPGDPRIATNIIVPGKIQVGDTKDPDTVLIVTAVQWYDLIGRIKTALALAGAIR